MTWSLHDNAESALEMAHRLAFPRYPGSAGDRRAIELVAGGMRQVGLDVTIEPFSYDIRPAFRAIRAVLLASAVLCASGGLLAAVSTTGAVLLLGVGLAAGLTLLSWSPWAERIYRRPGPTETANVVGRRAPAERQPPRTLVLVAHHDSKSQNLTFPVRMGLTLASVAGGLTLAGALIADLMGWSPHPRLAPVSGLVTALALAALSTLRSGNRSPGGVDNAGSVGILLELARILMPRLPSAVDLIVLSTGAEEDHMVGAMRWLDAHAGEVRDRPVDVLNFDGAGAPGRVVLIERYGFGRRFAPRIAQVARRVAADLGIPVRGILMLPAIGIDAIPFAHRGFECLSFSSGSLDRATLSVHSAGDRAEHLDLATVERVLRLAVGVAKALCPRERPES